MLLKAYAMVSQFFIKLNIYLASDPAIPLLDNHPRDMNTYAHSKNDMQMFLTVFSIITNNWK